MTSTPAILSALAERPRPHDLLTLQSVGGAPVVDVPLDSLGGAHLVVAAADGAMLAVVYLDLVGLFHAMRTQELLPRLATVKARWPWCYLVIGAVLAANADGKVRNRDGGSSGYGWNAVQGLLLAAQEMGVGVMQIPHADALAVTVEQLARRERGPRRVAPLRETFFYTEAEQILMTFPGIGEKTADALLAHCGTLASALHALTDDGLDMPGVGPETRVSARALLGLSDGQALMPQTAGKAPPKRGSRAA